MGLIGYKLTGSDSRVLSASPRRSLPFPTNAAHPIMFFILSTIPECQATFWCRVRESNPRFIHALLEGMRRALWRSFLVRGDVSYHYDELHINCYRFDRSCFGATAKGGDRNQTTCSSLSSFLFYLLFSFVKSHFWRVALQKLPVSKSQSGWDQSYL